MTTATGDEQDQQDMARLAAGHDAALNDLMARHSHRLFCYLVRILGNESEADDLAQETFVRVYFHRARFRPAAKFSTWLFSIATNLARDRLRWRARHPAVSITAEEPDSERGLEHALPADSPTPAETLESAERSAAVRRAVAELPEELRLPLLLAEYEGQSHAEIAAVLDCSTKAVEMRIYRARQQLRARLDKWLRAG
jgi:RNA polymerase sigma-70 factor (ECF subfamily)